MAFSPLRNFSVTFLSRIGDNVCVLLFYALAARCLEVRDFGIYFFAYSLAILIADFSDFGMHRFGLLAMSNNTSTRFQEFLKLMVFKLLFWIPFSFCVFGISTFFLDDSLTRTAFHYLFLQHSLYLVSELMLNVFRSQQDMQKPALWLFGKKFIFTSIAISILLNKGGLMAVIHAQIFVECISIFLLIIVLYRAQEISRAAWTPYDIFGFFWKLLPFAAISVFGMINLRISVVFLKSFSSVEEIAIFGSVFRLIESYFFIPIALTASVLPNWIHLKVHGEWSTLQLAIQTIFRVISLIFIPIGILILVFGNEMIECIYGMHYAQAGFLFKISVVYIILGSLNGIAVGILQTVENVRGVVKALVGAILTHMICAIYWVPEYGALGSFVSIIISDAVLFALYAKYFHRHFPVQKIIHVLKNLTREIILFTLVCWISLLLPFPTSFIFSGCFFFGWLIFGFNFPHKEKIWLQSTLKK
jgi:PST family polysaccharide transporter